MFEFFKKPKNEAPNQAIQKGIERDSVRENLVSPDFYKKFLSFSRAYLLPAALVLSVNGQSQNNKEQDDSSESANKISLLSEYHGERVKHLDTSIVDQVHDFEEILQSKTKTSQLLHILSYHNEPSVIIENFKRAQGRLRELGNYFEIESQDILLLEDENNIHLINDESVDQFIKHAGGLEKGDNSHFRPTLSNYFKFIHDTKLARNENFMNGVSLLKEYDVAFDGEILGSDSTLIEELPMNRKQRKALKMLRDEFDISVRDFAIKYIDPKFVRDNTPILSLVPGHTLNGLDFIYLGSEGKRLHEDIQDPVYRQNMKDLVDMGASLHLLCSGKNNQDPIYQSQIFIQLLKRIQDSFGTNLQSIFSSVAYSQGMDRNGRPSESYYSKYRLNTQEGCQIFFDELQDGKISLWKQLVDESRYTEDLHDFYREIDQFNSDRRVSTFIEDPALSYVQKLGYTKEKPPMYHEDTITIPNGPGSDSIFSLDEQLPGREYEISLWVARNMYIEGVSPTEENFKKYFAKTLELRDNQEFLDLELFKGRDVITLGHEEQGSEWEQGQRFLTQKTLTKIQDQLPETLTSFKPDSANSFAGIKNGFLEQIKKSQSPTIVFDGHGGPDALYLSNGEIGADGFPEPVTEDMYISFSELANALAVRDQLMPSGERPIFISSACFNQDFIRMLYEELEAMDIKVLPIMIGSSEYGQFGFSHPNSKFNNSFLEALLDHPQGFSTTIKDVIDVEQSMRWRTEIGSNPSIFVPIKRQSDESKGEIHWQIAEAEYLKNKTDENNPVT
ncbi:MAG: hypothetical protein K9M36_02395 [Candidatus Pacebacteria bacterium]|nr:hypothetical protein [Candidatus Paceibacterota bacterium]